MKLIFLTCFIFLSLGAESYRLENGLKVVLVPMESDGDVYYELSAKGGFAQLPLHEQAAGRVAASVIWEAGLDGFTSEELSSKLYEASVELTPEIYPLYRRVEGSGFHGGLQTLLEISTLLFKDPKLSEADIKKGLHRVAKKFRKEEGLKEVHFETLSHLLNTQDWPPFKPLTLEGLNEITWQSVKNFYQKAFLSPEEFVLVIVGDFEVEETKALIEKTLGSLPKKSSNFFKTPPPFPTFPAKTKSLTVTQKGRIDALSRITYPLKLTITPESRKNLAFLCKAIEADLQDSLRHERGAMHGIDVSYELPFFPYVSNPWVIVQFHANPSEIKNLSEKVEKHLKQFVMTQAIVEETLNDMESYEAFWEKMPSVKISQLSNVLLFGWSEEQADTWDTPPTTSPEALQKMMKEAFDFNRFTQLILVP